jgi:GntR family transcriptional repressor for pyruvate dehydrogenase complex
VSTDGLGFRPARTAQLVAGSLRERILTGEIADGQHLPKEDELREELGVSKGAMREALLILETEGLITVKRGKVGGSVVHLPTRENVAYSMGLVLNAEHVSVGELAEALVLLEPQCAALCAQREDRHEALVPELRRINAEMVANLDEPLAAVRLSREFHETLVQGCGNGVLTLLTGSLERLWSAHEQAWAARASTDRSFPPQPEREQAGHEHDEVVERIADGDAGVADVLRAHLLTAQTYPDPEEDLMIDLASLRPNGR